MILLPIQSLDADEFLLNTPSATYDLRKGMEGSREHRAEDFLTKCTTVDPGEEGREIWAKALGEFFTHDQDLIQYAQEISGLWPLGKCMWKPGHCLWGRPKWEIHLLEFPCPGAGNLLWRHLGGRPDGGLQAKYPPEMAELKGKRMVIAAEMEEGVRLSTSVLKQICSTDEVGGEKKYKAPFQFVPSHTIVLYTNHLPG